MTTRHAVLSTEQQALTAVRVLLQSSALPVTIQ
jgi:hypothetical protein